MSLLTAINSEGIHGPDFFVIGAETVMRLCV